MAPSMPSIILARLETRRARAASLPLRPMQLRHSRPGWPIWASEPTSTVYSRAKNMRAIPCRERTLRGHVPVLVGAAAQLILPAPAEAQLDTRAVIDSVDLMLHGDQAGASRRWKS